jgi:hypothetical protein
MATTLWEIALRKWNAQTNRPPEKNIVYEGILTRLAKIEEEQGNNLQAVQHLKLFENHLETILAQKELEPDYRTAMEERLQNVRSQMGELQAKDSGELK